ncbi:MAG: alpha/beta fold hydrolase [Promethearchaeota archaeon]|nr:MAG: alpha/beta fold hydrolase [Candidatus Lokiarchaeota archaeon]
MNFNQKNIRFNVKPKVIFIIFPIFVINSIILVYLCIVELQNILYGVIISLISLIPAVLLFLWGLESSKTRFENISKRTVNIQKVDLVLQDGLKTFGKIYRSEEETIGSSKNPHYPEARKAIVFFHGFYANKEINEKFLIPLAHLGYVTVAFDQRGHGEAEGKKTDWIKLYNDVDAILNYVCSLNDVKGDSLICIGISMGGTSVLTKCYQDKRVAMVIGISTLHDVEKYLNAKSTIFSPRWFIRRLMSSAKKNEKKSLRFTAHQFLRPDADYNKNRLYLIHGEDDKLFPPSLTFHLNKEQSQIPENQAILLDNCRHNLAGQELLILSIILNWIWNFEKEEKEKKKKKD